MPDVRFEAAYREAEQARGRPPKGLRALPRAELVAALAIAAAKDPAFANAIATELLNRLRRAPFLGASVACAIACVAIVMTNWVDAGTLLPLETGPRAGFLDALALFLGAAAFLAFIMYRGLLPNLQFLRIRRGW